MIAMDEFAKISWEGSARGKSQLFDLPPRHDGDPVAFAWKDAVRVGFRDNPMAVIASDHGRTAVPGAQASASPSIRIQVLAQGNV